MENQMRAMEVTNAIVSNMPELINGVESVEELVGIDAISFNDGANLLQSIEDHEVSEEAASFAGAKSVKFPQSTDKCLVNIMTAVASDKEKEHLKKTISEVNAAMSSIYTAHKAEVTASAKSIAKITSSDTEKVGKLVSALKSKKTIFVAKM